MRQLPIPGRELPVKVVIPGVCVIQTGDEVVMLFAGPSAVVAHAMSRDEAHQLGKDILGTAQAAKDDKAIADMEQDFGTNSPQ